ncbi:hypothetical protein M427DRAFT_30741 [Gonapodya prolifera JEL478]|uniref:Protein phosphatase inhibitor 2 n=1 Tax=Gonapodya prolifera (strain JEL478) TaxID=1344416 RepID=A0A139AKF2_GONPJ|nr:hypothetical protein M427DRAFT_30741 [Gonapodya prolifera JEL478]|eukprot:KXS16905.1 hypothetical protein M427DRAFT_30741 [Gonapodya prolifera JEL478]
MAAKGILKKQQDRKDAGRLHWDEDNLMIAEATRGGKMTITEPKTPFIRYDSATNMILGHSAAVPPLELERAIADQASAREDGEMDDFSLGAGMDAGRANVDGDRFGGRQSDPTNVVPLDAAFLLEAPVVGISGLGPGGAFGLGGASMEAPGRTYQDVDQQEEDPWEDDDEDDKNPEDLEKQHEFEDHRKSHYNMREAMVRARHLIEEDDDEDDGDAGKAASENKMNIVDADDDEGEEDEEDEDWSGPEQVVVKRFVAK